MTEYDDRDAPMTEAKEVRSAYNPLLGYGLAAIPILMASVADIKGVVAVAAGIIIVLLGECVGRLRELCVRAKYLPRR